MPLRDLLGPGLRVVIAGTIAQWHRDERKHYYAGPGNQFWVLLHASGLVPRVYDPTEDALVVEHGVGLTDLVATRRVERGEPPAWDLAGFRSALATADPLALAFVSKTAASAYARAVGERQPRGYGALPWTVDGCPAFVLPGPSGANNGMPLPLRTAMWRDLTDFLESL